MDDSLSFGGGVHIAEYEGKRAENMNPPKNDSEGLTTIGCKTGHLEGGIAGKPLKTPAKTLPAGKQKVKAQTPCPRCHKPTDWIAKTTDKVMRVCEKCDLVFSTHD